MRLNSLKEYVIGPGPVEHTQIFSFLKVFMLTSDRSSLAWTWLVFQHNFTSNKCPSLSIHLSFRSTHILIALLNNSQPTNRGLGEFRINCWTDWKRIARKCSVCVCGGTVLDCADEQSSPISICIKSFCWCRWIGKTLRV